jgi:hypothetical protein
MIIKLLVVVFILAAAVSDPIKPKNLYQTHSALEVANTSSPYKESFSTVDATNQRTRRDTENDQFNETVIIDYGKSVGYFIRQDKGDIKKCVKNVLLPKQFTNPFTFDQFASAIFAGEEVIEGKNTYKWENVDYMSISNLTAWVDVNTNLPVKTNSHDIDTFYQIKSTDQPDSALFEPPSDVTCVEQVE